MESGLSRLQHNAGGMIGARTARAFTLIDLLVTVAIMAVVAAVVVPALSPDNGARLRGGAMMLVSDIEYAQSMSLAEPGDPVIVRFGADGATYWLARESDPTLPIAYPGTNEQYLVRFGEGRASLLADASLSVAGLVDGAIAFDEFGRLRTLDDAVIEVRNEALSVMVRVDSSSGAVDME